MTDIETLCQRLQLAAMRCKTHLVTVDYSGHVDTLTVCVHQLGTDFLKADSDRAVKMFYRYVRLGADEAYGQLVAIADELTNMGVEV